MFTTRDAGLPTDAAFITAAFDASIAHLASAGNGGMWGPSSFSEQDGFLEAEQADVTQSVHFAATGEGERLRLFITETDVPAEGEGLFRRVGELGRTRTAVAFVQIRDDHFAKHSVSNETLGPIVKELEAKGETYAYVDAIATDFRAGAARKGAGAAVIDKAKGYAKEHEKNAIYVEVYSGGNGGLLPYYESHGFKRVTEFAIKRRDGTFWPGVLYRISVDEL